MKKKSKKLQKTIDQQNRYKKYPRTLIKDAKNKNNKDIKTLSHGDGWKNVMTGLGGSQDKSSYTRFYGYPVLHDQVLAQVWIGDGFGKRIVEVVADDMTREWLKIDNDVNNTIHDKMYGLETQSIVNLALKWKRLFGGSLIVMGINDRQPLTEPVNLNNIKSVDWLKTFDRTSVVITNINFNINPQKQNFGNIEFFTVTPFWGAPFNVHYTRVMEFKGVPVPDRITLNNFWYWGMSELQPIWEDLKDFGAGRKNVSKLLYEFIIGTYKMKDLAKKMAEGKEAEVKNRLNMIDLFKSMMQAILLDSDGEEYKRDSANVAGLADILDRYMMFVSGTTGIPVTRLFGRSPAGQNATGEADLMNYYDMIVPKQKNELQPQLQKLINYINLSKEIGKNKVDKPIIHFNKLFQLTETQEIDNRKKQAEIDKIYVGDLGVLGAEEVRESRFESGYSFETSVESETDEDGDLDVTVPK